MQKFSFKKNELIFSAGDAADNMYIISKGKIRIMSGDGEDAAELAILKDGAFFGEMGVIENAPRSASAYAETDVDLISISSDSFAQFVLSNPDDTLKIAKNLSSNLRKTTKKLVDATNTVNKLMENEEDKLSKISVFGKLKELISKNSMVENNKAEAAKSDFAAGEVIFYKGQSSDRMFKILKGEIDLFAGKDISGTPFTTLSTGAIFGEMGVLENERRGATAVAKSEANIMPITNGQLTAHFETNPDDAMKILKNLSVSLRNTNEAYLSALKIIHELMDSMDDNTPKGGYWDELSGYAKEYDSIVLRNQISGMWNITNTYFMF